MRDQCEWRQDAHHCAWDTGCGHKHQFIGWDDNPEAHGYRYCPYCGGRIEAVPACEEEGEA